MPPIGDLAVCQSGFELFLQSEMDSLGITGRVSGPGWVLADAGGKRPPSECAFAHLVLEGVSEVAGDRVNDLALQILDFFLKSLAGERVEAAWPCLFFAANESPGLGRRVTSVETAFLEALKKRLGRVSRLATPVRPRVGPGRGLFVWFHDFGKAYVSRSAVFTGPCRMADDDAAPSRSYLKIEEAYGIIGREPVPGEVVCDLGAAPGGWSYSAAKRGTRVIAVDNGPLKGGALGHPLIDHRCDDAFGFSPGKDAVYDWLFCDMLEDPRKVLSAIVTPWLSGGWCRRFVINLKFGRVDPVAFLTDLRSPQSPFSARTSGVRFSHLYHDREELTVTGSVNP